ncbi:protein DEHYDRATION-INDUCED 19 homolog 4-like [Impatiens glandulifera]|uniref:protein DEHYDRATION-INDUCED 19 homolog 4-like n=1 Tax=Impatiens glandulifera TaxID=253017 RepID=UPI001FB145F3|nr:protein DEHYDRATION-INDUCED 19 homolog 4-like [Impatiens glandulifera]
MENYNRLQDQRQTQGIINCPYCHELFQIDFLFSHLAADHSPNSEPAACPICLAIVLYKEMELHFRLEHESLFKRYPRTDNMETTNIREVIFVRGIDGASLELDLSSLNSRGIDGALLQLDLSSLNSITSQLQLTDDSHNTLNLNTHQLQLTDSSHNTLSSIHNNNPTRQKILRRSRFNSSLTQIPWRSRFDSSLTLEQRENRTAFLQELVNSTLVPDDH